MSPRKKLAEGATVTYHSPDGDVEAEVVALSDGRADLRYSDDPDRFAPYASEGDGIGQWSA